MTAFFGLHIMALQPITCDIALIKQPLLFKLALVLALIVVSYLVFSRPQYPQNIPGMDKVGHVGSFFMLSWLAYLAFMPRWYWLVLNAAIYGALIEIIQLQLPYRSGDVADFIADMSGVLLFYVLLAICRFISRQWKRTNQ